LKIPILTYKSQVFLGAPKIHSDLLWDLSILFTGLAILYFAAVFFFRNRISSKSEQVKQRKKELSPMISEFLFHEDDASKEEKSNYVNLKIEIRQLLKSDFNRQVLSEILLDLRKDVSGEAQKRLMKLYQDLGLHQDAFVKLKSWRWEVISKGISELTQMSVEESYSFITKFINDKRGTIRKQAEIATVTLKKEGIDYFLDTTKYRISEWQQLKLLDVLRNQEDFEPPRFKAWLTSNNKFVVLFALRLIKYYNQNDAIASLIELIKHKNNQIKEEAIACIKEFNVVEALEILKLVFWKSSVDIKISILGAIAVLGTEIDLEFLRLIENKESNFSVRSKAISSINTIAPGTIMPKKGVVQIIGNQIPEDIVQEPILDTDGDIYEPSATKTVIPSNDKLHTEQLTDTLIEAPKNEEMEEDNEKLNIEVDMDEITSINLDFLPIVVTEVGEKQVESISNSTTTQSNESDIVEDIAEFTVVYEDVEVPIMDESILSFENVDEDLSSLDELGEGEIAFIPIVIEDVTDSEKEALFHEEALANEQEIAQRPEEPIEEEMNIIGLEPDIDANVEPFSQDNSSPFKEEWIVGKRQDLFDEIKEAEALNLEVLYNEVKIDAPNKEESSVSDKFLEWPFEETIDEEYNELDNPPLESTEKPSKNVVDANLEIEAILQKLPEPKYYDGETILTMRLLDDIEALGDEREIPVLRELLEEAKTTCVIDRINEIMEAFELEIPAQPSQRNIKPISAEFKPFSVFEDLFRTCDTEAKLILMDEIIDIGDEKEVEFLKSLLDDPEIRIREKAEPILEGLQNKLFHESLLFEPSLAFIDDSWNQGITEKYEDSFLSQLLSFPNKIIEKLNG
jgi:HEAT repeat protein